MKPKEAFPKQTYKRLFDPWIKSTESRECLTIVNIPKRDQLYRINDLIIKKFSGKNTQIILIDLKGEIVEDPKDLDILINKKIDKKFKKIALIILDADQLLDEKYSLLSYLDKLYHDRPVLSLIYFFQKNTTSDSLTKSLSSYTSLFQNIEVYSLFNYAEMKHFIDFITQYFKVYISNKLKNKILNYCGGSPWLIKEAIRYYYQTRDEINLFNHDNMKLKLKILYQELSLEEKVIIEKIIKKDFQFNPIEQEYLNYLIKTGLVNMVGREYIISIPIFNHFVKELINAKNKLNINHNDQLVINNVLIEGLFSRREKRIIKYLLKNKEKILLREEVASVIWKNDSQESYTDWSLDQIIRRLRNKFTKLGLNRNIIQTKKNQGYKFID
ncbi:hypothetical protein A2767_05680 [Candidatus Roizmanbacteria bacterium RIFCSPHIGHO2_01_FULL_35_10]|nr:MAG: hypothetical protein A2767_05680 [Candidatus Roizmanbacteria bacterium RIFCSPHIGHO2_01_FULL_35_10]